ncbi:MAG TPA: DoxX family membrane protein [Candidatus Paceibacterota bacterium]|nr:DoxX family membrane protein [Candidatus Paceibacterota bacterium]
MKHQSIENSPIATFLFSNTKISWVWLVIRIYVGWQWLSAGLEKVHSTAWVGANAGSAITGFVNGAIAKTGGAHPDVQGWYASFLQHSVLTHPVAWAHMVAWGEVFVGIALLAGILTGIAAFFGLFMNLNYLLAGTVSTNPILFTLAIGIILAWRIAGYIGGDYFLLPLLGTPWHRGALFKKSAPPESQTS